MPLFCRNEGFSESSCQSLGQGEWTLFTVIPEKLEESFGFAEFRREQCVRIAPCCTSKAASSCLSLNVASFVQVPVSQSVDGNIKVVVH